MPQEVSSQNTCSGRILQTKRNSLCSSLIILSIKIESFLMKLAILKRWQTSSAVETVLWLILLSPRRYIAEAKKLLENTEVSKILSFKDRNRGTIKSIEKSWQSLSSVKEKSKDKKHRLYSIYERYKKIFSQIDEIRKKCYFCY